MSLVSKKGNGDLRLAYCFFFFRPIILFFLRGLITANLRDSGTIPVWKDVFTIISGRSYLTSFVGIGSSWQGEGLECIMS